MKEWRFSPFFPGIAADNLNIWTLVTWRYHKLWLCCTVQSSFEPSSVPVRRVQDESRCKLGATAVYEIHVSHEVAYIKRLCTILSWESALTRKQLWRNAWCLSHARDEHHRSTLWLLVSASCVIRCAECLLKSADLGGLSAPSRINVNSLNMVYFIPSKIWNWAGFTTSNRISNTSCGSFSGSARQNLGGVCIVLKLEWVMPKFAIKGLVVLFIFFWSFFVL